MKTIETLTEQSVVEAERVEAREKSELKDEAVTQFIELRHGAPHLAAPPDTLGMDASRRHKTGPPRPRVPARLPTVSAPPNVVTEERLQEYREGINAV